MQLIYQVKVGDQLYQMLFFKARNETEKHQPQFV